MVNLDDVEFSFVWIFSQTDARSASEKIWEPSVRQRNNHCFYNISWRNWWPQLKFDWLEFRIWIQSFLIYQARKSTASLLGLLLRG
jgi:hypothetical protein